MPESSTPNGNSPQRSSRILVFVMLGVIVLFIAAFLVFRPDPSGAGRVTTPGATPTTSDH
jgi:hypothetical protein